MSYSSTSDSEEFDTAPLKTTPTNSSKATTAYTKHASAAKRAKKLLFKFAKALTPAALSARSSPYMQVGTNEDDHDDQTSSSSSKHNIELTGIDLEEIDLLDKKGRF